jgi:gamma-glutamylcyclotransferase (GGCT)/AIG2-like uncharacterized protein YtfP
MRDSAAHAQPLPFFVYGTLLSGAGHQMGALLREHARLIGPGSFQGRLYIVPDPDDPSNAYPGAVPSGAIGDRVHGELYQITGDQDRLLAALDQFELCGPEHPEPHEFLSRQITVELADGTRLRAKTYLYTWDVSQARPVPGGRYTENGAKVR